jgi:hypothetical protein
MLKQLASQLEDMPSCLKTLYRNFKPETPRPDQAKLLDLFIECAKAYPEVFVFLDAFDECDPTLRELVVSIIKQFQEAKIKAWVTTQPGGLEDLAKARLNDVIKAEIKAKRTDVASYVNAKLRKNIENKLREEIVGRISSTVDGMYNTYTINLMTRFLLAKVQLDSVIRAKYHEAMKLQLSDLPKNPSESYMKGLERIQAEAEPSMKAALHALAWIYHAKRKLKMEELLDVIARTTNKIDYKFKPSDLIDIC